MNTMRDNTRSQMNRAQDTRPKPKPKPQPKRTIIRRG
jgi:hypothetical protein